MAGFVCVGLEELLERCSDMLSALIPFKGSFPALTLVTNILGALAIGIIAGARREKDFRRTSSCSLRPVCAEDLRHFPPFRWKLMTCWNGGISKCRFCISF